MDALLLCALPYHSTNEFVRLVQTLSIGKGLWSWMTKMQDSGAAMPRELLVKRCINDKVCGPPLIRGCSTNASGAQFYFLWVSLAIEGLFYSCSC